MNEDAKRRWSANEPVARIIYYGEPKLVDTKVYDFSSPAPHLLKVAINILGKLSEIVIGDSHLVALIGADKRATSPRPGDVRVFMDGASTRLISHTIRLQPGFSALAAMMVEDESNVRCLLGLGCLRQMQSEVEGALSMPFTVDGELWPELRHNT